MIDFSNHFSSSEASSDKSKRQDSVGQEDAYLSLEINPFASLPPMLQTSPVKQVMAVGGGKGGIGKSLITANLAISLSRMGHKVIAIDLDLGASNLHTTLGLDLPKRTLSDFLSSRTTSLDECLTPTEIPRLEILSGAQDRLGIANLSLNHKIKLFENFRKLPADYLIFDLGAGTNINTIDFFLYSDLSIILLLPEPTAIENAYRFIKSAYYRRLMLSPALSSIQGLIKSAMDSKNAQGITTPADLFREVNVQNPEMGMRLKEEIQRFTPKLITNQTRTQTDVEIGFSIKTVCKKYFGIEMNYIGYLDYDSSAWQSVRRKRPLILEFPNSRLVSSLERIAYTLTRKYDDEKNSLLL